MKFFAIIVATAAIIECIEWLLRNALALKVWKAQHHLTPDSPGGFVAGECPRVSMVVAAKDEEHNIEKCIRSLLRQDYPDFEVICVNDRSDDRTAEIVQNIAAQDSRVSLINIEKLPEGWCGKNHAMQHGLREANGDWIIMTDADCEMICPRTVSISIRHALDKNADMVSIVPTLEMGSFWEKLMIPICGGILMIWNPPSKVNNPRKKHAYANGQFMLIRKDAYQAIGTHAAVAGSLIEDIDLARNIKNSGKNLNMIMSDGLISVRMYTSMEQIVRGWVRIFIGTFPKFWQQMRALCVLWFKGLTLYIACVLSWIMMNSDISGEFWWKTAFYFSFVGVIAEWIMTCRFFVHAKGQWWYGLLYPIGCFISGIILIKSMKVHVFRGRITWRDTHYNAGQHAG